MMQNHIRLEDLLARDVAARWFEGVAVVQSVCHQLLPQNAGGAGFPRAADILIGPDGAVAVAGGSPGDPVQAAAHVLALMLTDDVPVRLRLAVTQATAAESGYASLLEFSEALAYFERPNPEAIIAGLRERAMWAAPRQGAPVQASQAVKTSSQIAAPQPASPPRRVSRAAVLAATVAAVVCASVWLVGVGGTDRITSALQPLMGGDTTGKDVRQNEPPKSAKADAAGRKTPKRGAGAAASAPRELTPVPKRVTTPAPLVSAAPMTAPAATAAAETAPADFQVSARTLYYRELSPSAPALVLPEVTNDTYATGDGNRSEGDAGEAIDRIYSKRDLEVTLPVNVYPRLPAKPPAADLTTRTILELTIASNGLVERVRLLSDPKDIHEFMLLSAAKAWRFEPARIGAKPVRFRHTMTISALP
ncbi:MAG: energy transducer TonB [Acidobacteriota bacterium]|nr:energy transducer TonB [Acidobacteriota bacterium]